ncbi:uncharacterized protein N7446_007541 [Penicillium canescens]|uniref:Uncharacterized protein n=1 Tax=Penicillium canescens TaxID=5083 RepID=A0AAD6ILW3_PENCN|nr:uncharacterized protein N7446_007541 [Penicillium canescens]KAJ6049133.1 hypothetical protein N7444_005849 [Penicillium canescens]KAJ6052896.1 hypothetical protein N7460_003430 [Penicillium canescens]KAJ6063421.1 hypothetical protein N7446_007541 [Penicillium canescens]
MYDDGDLKFYILGHSEERWKLITGDLERAPDITNTQAEVKRVEDQTEQDAATAEAAANQFRKDASDQFTRSSTTNSQASVQATTATAPPRITVAMVRDGMSAFEVFPALKKVSESTTHQVKCDRLRAWMFYIHKETKPFDFANKSRQNLGDYRAVFTEDQHPPLAQCSYMSIDAGSSYASVNAWWNAYTLSTTKTDAETLEALYEVFIASENRRILT